MRFPAALLLGFVLASAAQPAMAATDSAGSAVSVVPQATGRLDGTTQVLTDGADLYMGQQVITGQAGQVQVVFKDNTHLVIGPGSTLVISQYLMRGSDQASKFVINALSGSFRFVTGNSQKSAYQIATPTGNLVVRGTAFDFAVDPHSHQTNVLLYHGRVGMCEQSGQCVWMGDACSVGSMPMQTTPSTLQFGDSRRTPLVSQFPYAGSQEPLRDDFRIPGGTNCSHEPTAQVIVPLSQPTPPPAPPVLPPPDDGSPCGDDHDHHHWWWHHGDDDHHWDWHDHDHDWHWPHGGEGPPPEGPHPEDFPHGPDNHPNDHFPGPGPHDGPHLGEHHDGDHDHDGPHGGPWGGTDGGVS